jgi:hypothetical protein
MKNTKFKFWMSAVAAVGLLLSCSVIDPYGEGPGSNSTGGDTSILVSNIENGNGGGCTKKPLVPNGVSATAQSSSSIKISWNSVSGASYYNIYRAASSTGTYSNIGYVSSSSTSYTNTGLSSSTTYYYKITAENSCGESALSNYSYAATSSSTSSGTLPNAVQITLTSYKENGTHDVGLWGLEADPRISFIVEAYSSAGSLLSTNYSSTLLSLDDPSGGSWTGSETEIVPITAYFSAYKVSVKCQVLDKDVSFNDDISPSQYWEYYPLSAWLNQSESHTSGTSYDGCVVKYTVKFIRQ